MTAASSHANPSCRWPRASHSGCSDEASVRASRVSLLSWLHRKAARRLSISVSARSRRCSSTADAGVSSCSRHRRVMVAVIRADCVGFAGLTELLGGELANSFKEPVSRATTGVISDYERLIDEQGELIEHLIALHIAAAANELRGVEVESAYKYGQPTEQDAFRLGQQRVRPVHRGQ